MAVLTHYGTVSPAEFEDMMPDETNALRDRVLELVEQDRELQIELTKGIMRAQGARVI